MNDVFIEDRRVFLSHFECFWVTVSSGFTMTVRVNMLLLTTGSIAILNSELFIGHWAAVTTEKLPTFRHYFRAASNGTLVFHY